jgi:hypothetical protein
MVKHVTMAQFKVDLAELEHATDAVTAQAGVIDAHRQTITAALRGISQVWVTPARLTFDELTQPCINQMQALSDLLAEMTVRMRTAHHTYLAAEQANAHNLK